MGTPNSTCFRPSSFMLLGIPGLEHFHVWISIPFCLIFLLAIIGNYVVLLIIIMDSTLHQPMYFYFTALAFVDLILANSTMPKLFSIFWFQQNEISFHLCLIQMFLIHAFSTTESGIFLAMAYDRYVAICNPLRYSVILTLGVVIQSGVLALMRGLVYILPLPLFVLKIQRYTSNVIEHSYCEHMAVVRLSCLDASLNDHLGMTIGFLVLVMDSLLIMFSYVMILRAVLKLSKQAGRKAFGTCICHICAILAFYIPILCSSMVHRFGERVPRHIHIFLADFYLLVPPLLNPMVYGVRTKQIRRRVLMILS
ncbi:olfactory receptor 52M1-like [Gastrophryne carolinensis]